MKKSFSRGFTLIELLVVIAIIGILSSVVLVSLNSARAKGKDARVTTGIQQLRTQMESDYVSNYNSSFTATGATIAFLNTGNYATLAADIATNGSAGSVTISAAGTGGTNGLVVVQNGVAASGAFTTNVSAYALYGRLSTGNYFCISSDGKTNPSTATNNAISCP